MLGFGNNRERELQDAQLMIDRDTADIKAISSLHDPNSVALDTQVSAMVLEVPRRFLKWQLDKQKGVWVCQEKYSYKEPYLDEPLNFLIEGEERKLLCQIDNTLAQIYQFGTKYNEDMSSTFNMIVNVRASFLLSSRATGKAVKVAKSQYVETDARITRPMYAPPKKKLFGVL